MARPIAALALLTPAMAVLTVVPAAAKPSEPAFIVTAGETDAPRGFLDMCQSDPTFCAPRERGGAAEIVTGGIAGSTAVEPRLEKLTAHLATTSAPSLAPPFRLTPLAELVRWPDAVVATPGAPTLLSWDQPVTIPELRTFRFTLSTAKTEQEPCDALTGQPALAPAAAAVAPSAVPSPTAPGLMATSAPTLSPQHADKLLTQVNRAVNRHVAQRTDLQLYGRAEVWRRSGSGRNAAGDCEDIAIEKRYELVAAGFPADRLAFAVVYSRDAGLHTVLIARTDAGDVVLDNRTPYVRSWAVTGYNWIALQSMADPMSWHRVTRAESARA